MIFVLGGSGFVGAAFVRHCEERSLKFEIINKKNYDSFRRRKCDTLINCNGNSVKHFADREEFSDFEASVTSVKRSLCDFTFDRYVLISSGEVYPDVSQPTQTRESQILDLNKQTNYGFHKFLAEQCVRRSAANWLIFRLGGCVGPGLKKNPIYDILMGDGLWISEHSKLQYLATDTTAQVVMSIIQKGVSNEVFNLSGRGTVCLKDVMAWANSTIIANTSHPMVHSEISLAKINNYYDLPKSSDVVRLFVSEVKDGAIGLFCDGVA